MPPPEQGATRQRNPGRPAIHQDGADMQDTEFIEGRLRDASTLPEMLAAGFDAFEVIRRAARGCVNTIPGLFAAFMTTACEAVEGREAVTVAPSLPPGPAAIPASLPTTIGSADEVMTTIASLGALVAGCLSRAAAAATLEADRVACEEAAASAQRIRRLMARDDDAAGLR